MHAEEMAMTEFIGKYFDWQEIPVDVYVTHRPCENCISALNNLEVNEIHVADLSPLLWEKKDDKINPKHYSDLDCKDNKISSIKVFESVAETAEHYEGYLHLTMFKYIWRYHQKDDKLTNLKKARWFLDKLIEHVETYDGIN
jgi:hypothetical protein